MRDIDIRPMREEDVAAADRVCVGVLYGSFAGESEAVRADRKPVAENNPLLTMERVASTWMSTCWESYRLARDAMTEAMFLATYGSPLLQASLGLGAPAAANGRRPAKSTARPARRPWLVPYSAHQW